MIRNPEVHIPADRLDALKGVGVPTATNRLILNGFHNTYPIGLQALAMNPGQIMLGRARTLRFLPLREDLVKAQYDTVTDRPHRMAIESIKPGDFLVVDAGGCLGAGVAGDMFTRRILHRGGTGLLVDGVIRDLAAIRSLGLPVFCRGVHGAGINRELMSVGFDEPIQVGGVPVPPGDVIMGDENGVVAIPPDQVEDLIAYGLEHELEEEFGREKLAQGYGLHQCYPPDEERRKEYEEWRRQRPS